MKFVIVDFVVVGLQRLEQFLGQLLLVLERVLGQQKGESQGPEMDEAGRCGLLVEDLVVLVDSRLEGGVRANESKQLRVLVVVGADAAIEEDVTTHLSYIIILKPGLRSTLIRGQRTGRAGLEGRGRGIGGTLICIIFDGSYINEQFGAVCRCRLLQGAGGRPPVLPPGHLHTVSSNPLSYRDIALNNHPALCHPNPNQAYQTFSQAA